MKYYYEAYDKRYRQVHDEGLTWSPNNYTKLIEEVMNKYNLNKVKMLEIGCGEGRDARYLLNKNYDLLAVDVSGEAIDYCKKVDINHIDNYKVIDVLKDNSLKEKFDFIYSIACLHMLVLDDDRTKFYKFIYEHLNEDGYCLVLTMGDGIHQSESDITKAFDNTKRIHQESNQEINIATTSCRIVNFDTLCNEVKNNKFKIIDQGITEIENHFNKIMYIIIKKYL